jgi:glucokinase
VTATAASTSARSRPRTVEGPVLALDLGASRIRVAGVGPDGRLFARDAGPTPGEAGPDAVVAACIGRLRGVVAALDAGTRSALVGIGLSAPGPLDPHRGILVEPPNIGPGFRDVPFAEPIAQALNLPVRLERDTHVAALAEQAFGAAREAEHFLYITVSTGIGGAIVAAGELYGGADGVAGEIGHIPVGMPEVACMCGTAGHLEGVSSGSGIARQAAIAIAAGRATGLRERAERIAPAQLDAAQVAEAEAAGDPDAAAIMGRARQAFAAALIGLVNVFNPELVVVGGGLARAQGERWLGPARRAVEEGAFRIPRDRVRIVPAALGDDVGLVGAQPLLARSSLPVRS